MKIVFNYDKKTIRIIFGSYDNTFHISDSITKVAVGAIWPLIVFNYMLIYGLPYDESTGLDLITIFPELVSEKKRVKDFSETISKSVSYLNKTVFADFECLIIDAIPTSIEREDNKGRKVTESYHIYSFTEKINSVDKIEWEIQSQNLNSLRQYGINSEWIGEYSRSLSEEEKAESAKSQGDIAYSEWEKDSDRELHVNGKTKQTIIWNGEYIERMAVKFSSEVIRINNDLLPGGECGDAQFDSLKEYILDEYIDQKKNNNSRTFAIVEGGMGAGKTYSANSVCMELVNNENISFTIPAYAIYSENGTNSLLAYICRYMIGGKKMFDDQKLRILLDKAKHNENEKLVILIDCIDEVYPGLYKRLADEINEIARMGHTEKNVNGKIIEGNVVYFILFTRNAGTFVNNSGIIEESTYLQKCVYIKLNELDLNKVTHNKKLKDILAKFPEPATPLVVSYFNEMLELDRDLKDHNRKTKAFDQYGGNVDLKQIRNYYDLFDTRTKMLCAHAEFDNNNSAFFQEVLPSLAYRLMRKDERRFGVDLIASIDDPVFEGVPVNRRAMILVNTGIIREADGSFEFSHLGYMQFLAARYAANIFLENETAVSKKKNTARNNNKSIIVDAINKTSFYPDESTYTRTAKMRLMPYYYFFFMDIINRRKSCGFDTDLYRLGTNIGYEEQFDIWDEIEKIEETLITRYNGLLLAGKSEREKALKKEKHKYESWKLINSTNSLLYTVLTQREDAEDRWELLVRLRKDLFVCAAAVMFDIYYSFDNGPEYESIREKRDIINAEFCKELMNGLLNKMKMERPDFQSWKYPIDLVGRIYSNIGAIYQAMAKYAYKNSSKVKLSDSYKKLLDNAVLFHNMSREYRLKAVEYLDKETRKKEISLIRSDITIAMDLYYRGCYEEDSEISTECFDQAIIKYYDALKRQGFRYTDAKQYRLDMDFPIQKSTEIEEEPHIGAEPHGIWWGIGRCQYMKYSLVLKSERKYAENLAVEQFESLRAAYLFLLEECVDNYVDRKLDRIKIGMNASAIDDIWEDVCNKYIESYSDLPAQKKEENLVLIKRIMELYTKLHKRSGIKEVEEKDGALSIAYSF